MQKLIMTEDELKLLVEEGILTEEQYLAIVEPEHLLPSEEQNERLCKS